MLPVLSLQLTSGPVIFRAINTNQEHTGMAFCNFPVIWGCTGVVSGKTKINGVINTMADILEISKCLSLFLSLNAG